MISVIMSTYKEPIEYIKKSIDSILKQSYRELELILVIDFPGRKDIVDYIGQKKDNRVRIIANNKNIGLTASLNKGIALAHGEYIARMDADDISDLHRLQKQLDFLLDNECDLIGCNIIDMDMDGEKAVAPTIYPEDDSTIKKFLRYGSPMAHPSWLGKADIFKKNKYIDYLACEDYEFLTRVALQGKKLGNLSEPLLFYRLNKDGISSSKRAIQKTSLKYVSRQYRKKHVCEYEDYLRYMSSRKGKNKEKSFCNYYSVVKTIKNNKSKGFLSVFHVLPLFANIGFYELMYAKLKIRRIRKKALRNMK